jgi:hypothetical protein
MSNFKRRGEIRVVGPSHQRTDRDFLLDAFINKGNKQAAKRARVASLKAGNSQTIQSGIDESTHAANSLRILTLFLFIGKTPSFNYEGVFSKICDSIPLQSYF